MEHWSLYLMVKTLIPSIILLFSLNCLADGTGFVKYGIGLNNPEGTTPVGEKIISFGYQHPAFWVIDYQLEMGGFIDNFERSKASSAFAGPSLGISIVESYYYAKVFSGIIGLANVDSRLGGHFQFNHDLELGLKDTRNIGIGCVYKHMSSAGIYTPNLGRDWFMLKLSLPF